MSAHAVAASLRPERAVLPDTAPHAQAIDVAAAYCFSGRYFSPGLTTAVAVGSKTAAHAASEVADLAGFQQTAPAVERLRQSLTAAAEAALLASASAAAAGTGTDGAVAVAPDAPGVSTRVADVQALIAAALAAPSSGGGAGGASSAARRPAAQLPPAGAASSSAGGSARSGAAAATQYRAALRALLRFLRRRRLQVEEAWAAAAAGSAAPAGKPRAPTSQQLVQVCRPSRGAASSPAIAPIPCLLQASVGGRFRTPPGTAFEAFGRPAADLRGLRLAIDTAILRALLALGQDGRLCRFVVHPTSLDTTDAEVALRAAGRLSALALLHAHRALFSPLPAVADAAAVSALQVSPRQLCRVSCSCAQPTCALLSPLSCRSGATSGQAPK